MDRALGAIKRRTFFNGHCGTRRFNHERDGGGSGKRSGVRAVVSTSNSNGGKGEAGPGHPRLVLQIKQR